MTDDLVKRLRFDIYTSAYEKALRHEAADRIEAQDAEMKLVMEINERLLAALRKICDGPRDADKSYPELFAEVCWEARAALNMEKTND